MTTEQKLTGKMEAFCREYIIDLNAKQAAIRAGYSEATSGEMGYENLNKPQIQARLAQLMAERNERLKVDADYVLKRLVQIDEMDVLDILADNGEVKPISQWPKVWRTYLSGMDVAEINSQDGPVVMLKKIKWPDKVKNLELLGKHIDVQAFKEQKELSGGITIEPKGLDDFYGDKK